MRLSDGIEQYVAAKRQGKVAFKQPEAMLMRFSRQLGDVTLCEVTTQDVSNYLDINHKEPYIWNVKYVLLRSLFEYWTFRGAMKSLSMPHRRVRVRSTFIPYVYNHAEIRSLLDGTSTTQEVASCALDAKTFRMILLLLYATGISQGEAVQLRRLDFDFKKRMITVLEPRSRRCRTIPISEELCSILRDYCQWRFKSYKANDLLFLKKSGACIPTRSIQAYFARLVRRVGVGRRDGIAGWPRMADFRSSFAVHRIAEWLREGANMNQMLPALGTYLGQLGSHSTERYMRLTPERFRKPLLSLSPKHGRKRWCDDENLMRFLTTI